MNKKLQGKKDEVEKVLKEGTKEKIRDFIRSNGLLQFATKENLKRRYNHQEEVQATEKKVAEDKAKEAKRSKKEIETMDPIERQKKITLLNERFKGYTKQQLKELIEQKKI